MKNYDPNIIFGNHTVRFTMMCWDYVGHISKTIGGNCKGYSVLSDEFWENDAQEDIDHYTENDCDFSFDEDMEIYTATLTNPDGNTLDVEWEPDEVSDNIVSIEFTNFKEENNNAET